MTTGAEGLRETSILWFVKMKLLSRNLPRSLAMEVTVALAREVVLRTVILLLVFRGCSAGQTSKFSWQTPNVAKNESVCM